MGRYLAFGWRKRSHPGLKHYSFIKSGQVVTWGPVYYAAKLIGAQVALAINEPHTNKTVDVLGWEKELKNTEIKELIQSGVCVGGKSDSGRFITKRTITTYGGDLLQENEFSIMREALFVTRDLRMAIEDSITGKGMSNSLLGRVDGVVIGKLPQYYDMGLFNGDPPFWGYKKTVLGDQIKVDYNCNLTPPTNFVFIASHMHVYASTA